MNIDPKFTMDCLFIVLKEYRNKQKKESLIRMKDYYYGNIRGIIFALRMLRLDTKQKYFLDGYNVKNKENK